MATMPLSAAATDTEPKRTDEAILTWTVHLVRLYPERLTRLGIIVLCIFAVSLCVFHSFWLALLPVSALLLSLSEYLCPIQYILTKQSVSARHGLTALEMRWADVRHIYLADDGIKLSPLRARNSRFEPLRGVFLRFGAMNKAEVIAAIQRHRSEENTLG